MENRGRITVFYHYFEANDHYRDNFIYFLTTCYDKYVEYYITISGDVCSVDLIQQNNITYIRCENKNLDYGGFSTALSHIDKIHPADVLIFINCSVRGPFLPAYLRGPWTDTFTEFLKDDVHLVGTGISLIPENARVMSHLPADRFSPPYAAIQTTAYALTGTAVSYLRDLGFYDNRSSMSKDQIVAQYEVRLSLEIMKRGWKIHCLLPTYGSPHGSEPNLNLSARGGDPHQRRAFFSRSLHPVELIFIKTARHMLSDRELASHTYTALLDHQRRRGIAWAEGDRLLERLSNQIVRDMQTYQKFRKGLIWKIFRNSPPFRIFYP